MVPEAALRLQRLAGNRAVGRWLGSTRGMAGAVDAPAEATERFHEVIPELAADVRRLNETIKQLLPRGRFKVGADEFVRRLDWLVGQLTWVTHAMGWARRLADEAKAGGPERANQLAAAGTHLTAAIFGARAVSILLAYDAFLYEEQNAYSAARLDEQSLASSARNGALMAHRSLDPALANLSTRSPVRVDAAVAELLSYNWGWAFNQMKADRDDAIEAHARVERWLHIAMLVQMAFDIWTLAAAGRSGGGGGAPRIGGMGGGGAAVAATVLTSAESAEALRRLAALGILTAPAFVKHLSGSAAGQATPKPMETSTKEGTGGEPAAGSVDTPAAAKADAKAKAEAQAQAEPKAKPETDRTKTTDKSAGKAAGTAAAQTGPLEGERNYKVFERGGRELTDIDHFEGKTMWEDKSAVNASNIVEWVAEEVTRKFELYLRARERLPSFYRDANIGFRFSHTPKQKFWDAVMNEIDRLRKLHPDVKIEVQIGD
jgi:hypothetical protein